MRVGWLIDGAMFPAYRDELAACVRAQGHALQLIGAPSPPYRWEDVDNAYRNAFPAGACVVTHGDIELVTRVARERRWAPGAFATVAHFACSHYFCYFGEYLLGREYLMVPFGELRRMKDYLFETIGSEGQVFVRPDSPLKLFTGQIMSAATFDQDYEFMGFYEFPQESIVVVSAPRVIAAEWRFVIADREVVAGSQYKLAGKNVVTPTFDAAARELAETIAKSAYQPDRVWVMDVCRTAEGEYRLLEIGGFSFSDLYACDKAAVVESVSRAAWAEWKARSEVGSD
jgi:hypothetical protein